MGRISDLIFRTITAEGPVRKPNAIKGWGKNHRVSNVRFEDVKVKGQDIANAKEGNFQIDPDTTDNIRFKVSRRVTR